MYTPAATASPPTAITCAIQADHHELRAAQIFVEAGLAAGNRGCIQGSFLGDDDIFEIICTLARRMRGTSCDPADAGRDALASSRGARDRYGIHSGGVRRRLPSAERLTPGSSSASRSHSSQVTWRWR